MLGDKGVYLAALAPVAVAGIAPPIYIYPHSGLISRIVELSQVRGNFQFALLIQEGLKIKGTARRDTPIFTL